MVTASVEKAAALLQDRQVTVTIGRTRIVFTTDEVGGHIDTSGRHTRFVNKIVAEPTLSQQN